MYTCVKFKSLIWCLNYKWTKVCAKMQHKKMDHCHVPATTLILVFVFVSVSALKTTNLTPNASLPSVVATSGKPLH